MDSMTYTLPEVLVVAGLHPFYNADVQYPPDDSTIRTATEAATASGTLSTLRLEQQPLLLKKTLYATIERLIHDTSLQNTYRRSVYASTTGGGSGGIPLCFATDVNENRRQRAYFGRFLQVIGLVQPGDWVLSLHTAGRLYRSLDLTLEILENAQASVLAGGSTMSPEGVIQVLTKHSVNVLTGDGGQIVGIAHHIAKLTEPERENIKIDKIIYTSEMLTTSQRKYLLSVFGPVKICSIIGSAEAGAYAASCDCQTETNGTAYTDFIFDTRTMIIEILPPSSSDGGPGLMRVPDGQKGMIAQTSLMRLRHPLVRYVTGDVGSLHPLSGQTLASVPEADRSHLRILRLYGRDQRFSFTWNGEYFDFQTLTSIMNDPAFGVLQWQVILDKLDSSPEALLSIRLLLSTTDEQHQQDIGNRLRYFCCVEAHCEHRFRIDFVDSVNGFERSSTGNKVIKFINRHNVPNPLTDRPHIRTTLKIPYLDPDL